jgi:hypothetical protein
MLNPQLLSQDTTHKKPLFDILEENNLCLFNFSNLKSKGKLQLSDYNSFNFDFSKNERNFAKINTSNHIKEEDNLRYIKNINIDLPSIKDEEKNKILNDYDDSFVKFCGISKKQFSEIYLSNLKFNPSLNEFGDIMICIKGIIDLIKTFSESKRLKIKRNRPKKKVKIDNKNIFKILQTEKKEDKNNSESEEKNSVDKNEISEQNNDIENASNIIINIKNDEKNGENLENKEKQNNNKTLFNIKKKLKNIVIPKTDSEQISKNLSNSSIESKKDLNSTYNNINLNNDNSFNINIYDGKKTNSSGIIRHLPLFSCKNLSNQSLKSNIQNSNNIFNFSSNAIQNFVDNPDKNKNEIPSKHLLTPNLNSNNNLNSSLNNNLNTPKSRPILSPLNLSPGTNNNILSPNLNHFSNLLSPIIPNNSPFNINNMFNDCFNFNNANTTSFIFGNNDNIKKNIENDENNFDKSEGSKDNDKIKNNDI